MRIAGKFFLFIIFILGVNACFDPPQFSVVPVIDTPVLRFYDVDDATADDSLTVVINFKDGDGDLGLSSADPGDVAGDYANKYYFNLHGEKIDFGGQIVSSRYYHNENRGGDESIPNDTLLTYSAKRTSKGNDTLPDFVPPFECTRYTVVKKDSVDTLYVQLNPNTFNIFVSVLVQDANDKSKFNLFDFSTEFESPNCFPQGFNSRFPLLSTDPAKPAPLEGKIQYGIVSSGWNGFFQNDVLKLQIQIQDRALHRSNILVTNSFRLTDIE